MKKLISEYLFLLFLISFSSVFAQENSDYFKPFPTDIQKIVATQHGIEKGDTISQPIFEYSFDRRGNLIGVEYFDYSKSEIKYDSLDRIKEEYLVTQNDAFHGNTRYYYPSKNQKIEIHDKMNFHQYIKTDFTFNAKNKISKELRYDSTFNFVDSTALVYKFSTTYSYDKYGNKVKEVRFDDSLKKVIYKMNALYDNKNLLKIDEIYYRHPANISYFRSRPKNDFSNIKQNYFYIKKGYFKGKIYIQNNFIKRLDYTHQGEIHFTYKKTDSLNSFKTKEYFIDYPNDKADSQNIVEERKYFNDGKLSQINKYFYRYTNLIAFEEYFLEEDIFKIGRRIEYQYYFYLKNE
ncbi:hypothetical protein ACE193_24425 [Bernardetia sp. OM2101]|uniref:hypothetical protein n=1 Tax=Bernardetia sp. OM2101 TaxID=3344876 RepID=UPI0035CFD2EE